MTFGNGIPFVDIAYYNGENLITSFDDNLYYEGGSIIITKNSLLYFNTNLSEIISLTIDGEAQIIKDDATSHLIFVLGNCIINCDDGRPV